jgi:hypothetical protein
MHSDKKVGFKEKSGEKNEFYSTSLWDFGNGDELRFLSGKKTEKHNIFSVFWLFIFYDKYVYAWKNLGWSS